MSIPQINRMISRTGLMCLLLIASVLAQETDQGYKMPPKSIADLVDAPWTPRVSISPDQEWMLLMRYPGLPSIEEVSQPELRLAGLRINPRTNGPSRGWYLTELAFKKISDGTEYEITGLPAKPHITNITWSPNGAWVAFINTDNNGLKLWVISLKDRTARQVSDLKLNGARSAPFSWLSDNKTFVAKAIPKGRGEAPAKPTVPDGPIVQENLGRKAPARTYQDLLQSIHDESVFEYYMTSQIVRIMLDGTSTPLNETGMYLAALPSPDGKYILAEQIHPPYSYTVPLYRFPLKSDVWNLNGDLIHEVADLPLADEIPIAYGSVRIGRRSIDWRADTDATLYWTEAQDGGDAGAEADERDRVFLQ